MATIGTVSVKKSGGYRNLRFVDPLPDKYRCPVCKSALRDPMQTFCGHRVCSPCLPTTDQLRYVFHPSV